MSYKNMNHDDVINRAYQKIRDLKQQLSEAKADSRVAIVGYGCRFPGGVSDGEGFWKALNVGRDMFSVVGEDRWNVDLHYDSYGRTPGRMYSLAAGLTQNVDRFDAPFFGIPAIEADSIDPQQRMLLEVSWHAFEDAGLDPRLLRGSNTGVFVGLTSDDYLRLHARSGQQISAYSGLGSAKSLAAGRLAYAFDFHGPALQLDTTCSSGLVALHLAARELRDGTCDLAIVGGANAIVSPDTTIGFCEMNALSRRGKLRAFDHEADGYVRGEGCGVLILKRYSDAVRDNDRIHAVVLGSAINHDGRTNGLTAPNPVAQENVLRSALLAANRRPRDVQYVEAHGTGTPLGDLIEANALGAVYGDRADNLRIGSVKANIGHLEAASGIASVIKVILGMRHGMVPGQVNFESPNKRVDWNGLHLEVSASDWVWSQREGERCAGISSFGMSGTNVHVVLGDDNLCPSEQASLNNPVTQSDLLLLSARTQSALKRRIEQWHELISGASNQELIRLKQASRTRATHFEEYRLAMRGGRQSLMDELKSRASQELPRTKHVPRSGVVFTFGDDLPCLAETARGLYCSQSSFSRSLDECAEAFRAERNFDLLGLCFGAEADSDLSVKDECRVPVLVALGIAMASLWRSIGVAPTAVVANGAGEYAASVCAGSLSVAEAMRLAVVRGRLEANRMLSDEVQWSKVNGLNDYRSAISSIVIKTADVPWVGASGVITVSTDSVRSHLAASTQRQDELGAGIKQIAALGYRHFVEVGAWSFTSTSIAEYTGELDVVIAGLTGQADDVIADLDASVAQLYEAGAEIVPLIEANSQHSMPDLPKYPFEPHRHWMKPAKRIDESVRSDELGYVIKEVVGTTSKRTYKTSFDFKRQPHLAQHKLFGVTVFAGASWIALLLSLGRTVLGTSAVTIRGLKLVRALVLPNEGVTEVSIEIDQLPAGGFRFVAFSSLAGRAAIAHCEGELIPYVDTSSTLHADQWRYVESSKVVDLSNFYGDFTSRGYNLGSGFHWIHLGEDGETGALRALKRPNMPADEGSYVIHPGLIDSCFHALAGLLESDASLLHGASFARGEDIVIPAEIEEIRFNGNFVDADDYVVYASRYLLDGSRAPLLCGGLSLHESSGKPALLEVHGLQLKRIAKSSLQKMIGSARTYQVEKKSPIWNAIEVSREADFTLPVIATMGDIGDTLESVRSRSSVLELRKPWEDGFNVESLREALRNAERDDNGRRRISIVGTGEASFQDALDGSILDQIGDASKAWVSLMRVVGRACVDGPILLQAVLPLSLSSRALSSGITNASVAAILKTGASEYKGLTLQVIDCADDDSSAHHTMIDSLFFGALSGDSEGEYLWSCGVWERRALVPAVIDSAEPLYLDGGIALVTGGTGGMSPALAAWLLDRGAGEVWMLGRSCVDESIDSSFDGRVIYRRCDVTDQFSLASIFQDAAEKGRVITAVVHAAGVLSDSSIDLMTADDLKAVLAPKVSGAINLERCWNLDDIRLVAVTSSLVSLMASPGQAAYAGANRFLDRWVDALRERGVRAVAINFGPVDAGMAARLQDVHRQRIRRQGLDLLPLTSVQDAMEAALTMHGAQLAFYATSADLSQRNTESAAESKGGKSAEEDVLKRLSRELALMIGHGGEIPADMSLENVGMDSLLAVELAAWISDAFSIEFPIEEVLRQATVGDLASAIVAANGAERNMNTSEEVAI